MFGTSAFAVPVLEAVAARHDVVGVVTQPDRPAGRGQRLVATPVKRAADARGLRVLTPERLRPFADEARALGAEVFVVASYGKIVPQALLDLVPVAFNVHPSLLPLYRGATPLQSAIRDGRNQTGVTIIAMDAGMDTGDVLLQETLAIGGAQTYGDLHDQTARIGAAMAVEAIDRYAQGTLAPRSQVELATERGITEAEIAATLTRPLRKDDLKLPASATARALVDFIRSRAPEPSARVRELEVAGQPDGSTGIGHVRIVRAHVSPIAPVVPAADAHLADGRLIVVDGHWFIKGTDGWIAIDELIPAGGRKMTMREYANGHKYTSPDVSPASVRPLAEIVAAP
ncbi:MAG: methionyl-tRNA formyltransferase [Candidatus Elarobacter sp.]